MKDNRVQVRRVLWITLLLNIFVMTLKTIIGMITGSLSLQADALHSVTDSANNVLGLVANRFSSPYPDREHPYGHQKFEGLGALGISTFLGIVCFEIFKSAIARIFVESKAVTISPIELALLLIVLVVNIFVATYESREGRRINSPILIADAKHTMSDIWVTLLVIGGLAGIWQAQVWDIPQLQWLDVVLAFPVGLLVFRSGWEILQDNLPWLVDAVAIAPEAIHRTVMEVPGVINCHDIASRGVIGRQVFVEMHLIVDATDVKTAHQITEAVEDRLESKYSPIRISIHIEPPDYKSEHISFGSE
ncbi:cation diffusion facilitator family transporter [Xenococcus sp. PCC 7305]|uniref:cation diffusion facilitator family transporter n=1 Tax=Xenococcus sp. PCC 7305 TaxID=102125 RepID=UPI0002ABD366|nr:cation diffusion facilitator family transporter [Xenococcus sp. PCC 7305]ELS04421.1 cation diffusion facilitator family transporter [Xenococcus sp. PCC 7305]